MFNDVKHLTIKTEIYNTNDENKKNKPNEKFSIGFNYKQIKYASTEGAKETKLSIQIINNETEKNTTLEPTLWQRPYSVESGYPNENETNNNYELKIYAINNNLHKTTKEESDKTEACEKNNGIDKGRLLLQNFYAFKKFLESLPSHHHPQKSSKQGLITTDTVNFLILEQSALSESGALNAGQKIGITQIVTGTNELDVSQNTRNGKLDAGQAKIYNKTVSCLSNLNTTSQAITCNKTVPWLNVLNAEQAIKNNKRKASMDVLKACKTIRKNEITSSTNGLDAGQMSQNKTVPCLNALNARQAIKQKKIVSRTSALNTEQTFSCIKRSKKTVTSTQKIKSNKTRKPMPIRCDLDKYILRPFECDICHRRFTLNSNLSVHKRSHTGERFVCEYCSKGFTRKYLLSTHKKRVHSNHTGIAKD